MHRSEACVAAAIYFLGQFCYGVDYFLVVVECDSVLAIIAEPHGLAYVPCAVVGRHYALQHFYECALADTIGAYDSNFFSTCESVGKIV